MLPRHQLLDQLPVTSIVAVTQTAMGFGLGLLLSGKMPAKAQRNTAIALVSVGLASTLPVVVDFFARQFNRPESARGMRRRLESIRRDPGFSEHADIY